MSQRTLLFAFLLALLAPPPARAQILQLPHPDSTAGNFFGVSVSIDGNRALVGASAEDSCGTNSGAAYVFERADSTDTWEMVARLQASDCEAGDFFGRSLALSGDRALVASAETFFNAAASNAAYIFERDPATGIWRQTARLTADIGVQEGAFATSVDLDGDRALITTSGDPSNGRYGGAAYVFDYDPRTRTWLRSARLTASRGVEYGVFGGNGVLDGDRIAVAASTYFEEKPCSVYVFERGSDGKWSETDRISSVTDFFISIDL
ncbi:MAG TPA: FG-GAP repeat protein, partial [Rhodothermales bacterium]